MTDINVSGGTPELRAEVQRLADAYAAAVDSNIISAENVPRRIDIFIEDMPVEDPEVNGRTTYDRGINQPIINLDTKNESGKGPDGERSLEQMLATLIHELTILRSPRIQVTSTPTAYMPQYSMKRSRVMRSCWALIPENQARVT